MIFARALYRIVMFNLKIFLFGGEFLFSVRFLFDESLRKFSLKQVWEVK